MKSGILLTAFAMLITSGCATIDTIKNVNIANEFEKSVRSYNQLVRWQEFESAAAAFVRPSLRVEYLQRVRAAGEFKVADYRVKALRCDPAKGEAAVQMEYDYYRPPATRLLTVAEEQQWSYDEANGSRSWQLKTLLPTFK